MVPVHGLKIYGSTTLEIPHIAEYAGKNDVQVLGNGALATKENCRIDATVKKDSGDISKVQTAA